MKTTNIRRSRRFLAVLAAALIAGVAIGLTSPWTEAPAQPLAEFDTSP